MGNFPCWFEKSFVGVTVRLPSHVEVETKCIHFYMVIYLAASIATNSISRQTCHLTEFFAPRLVLVFNTCRKCAPRASPRRTHVGEVARRYLTYTVFPLSLCSPIIVPFSNYEFPGPGNSLFGPGNSLFGRSKGKALIRLP